MIISRCVLSIRFFWYRILIFIGFNRGALYYICGNGSLPEPLGKDEEQKLLSSLKEDSAVRSVLIERNLRLVVYISRKFENTGINIEDLISIGTIGLIKAINTFDNSKNIKLATYSSRCIENEILMYLRRNNKTRSDVSFDDPLNIDWDGNELLLSDLLGTDNNVICKNIEEQTDKQILREILGDLSDRECEILKKRFGLDGVQQQTQKDIADMLGISQSYISRLEKRIIKRLRKEFNKLS